MGNDSERASPRNRKRRYVLACALLVIGVAGAVLFWPTPKQDAGALEFRGYLSVAGEQNAIFDYYPPKPLTNVCRLPYTCVDVVTGQEIARGVLIDPSQFNHFGFLQEVPTNTAWRVQAEVLVEAKGIQAMYSRLKSVLRTKRFGAWRETPVHSLATIYSITITNAVPSTAPP